RKAWTASLGGPAGCSVSPVPEAVSGRLTSGGLVVTGSVVIRGSPLSVRAERQRENKQHVPRCQIVVWQCFSCRFCAGRYGGYHGTSDVKTALCHFPPS